MDAFIDLFITLCIVINTAFMAIDHYGMDKQLTETLRIGNYVSIKDIFLKNKLDDISPSCRAIDISVFDICPGF